MPVTSQRSGGLTGRIPDLSDHSVFIAGSPAFVDDCLAVVRRLGGRDGLVHTEGYFPQHRPEAAAL